jgi:uncharacterized membrane protein YjjP (DUF1212 family)
LFVSKLQVGIQNDHLMKKELAKIADVLLETGAMLMESGANTGRIRVTVTRIVHSLGYQVELLILTVH